MARAVGSKNRNTYEFFARYDKLCTENIDPLQLMFQICAGKAEEVESLTVLDEKGTPAIYKSINDAGFRVEAAKQLLSYRYPKLKSVELKTEQEDTQMDIGWLDAPPASKEPEPVPAIDGVAVNANNNTV